jgi:hypothetical protein
VKLIDALLNVDRSDTNEDR